MSILDSLTGGKSKEAADALKRAEQYYTNIKAPTAQDLTLPELQKYVQAGIMTPAEAETAFQKSNAYNNIKLDPASMETEMKTLKELGDVSDSGGMTDEMKAQMAEALDQVATNTRGTNAGILDRMAQRGVPTSLMGTAAMLAESGDQARNANLTASQSAGQAEQNAINAMLDEGNLASSIHGQQYNEEATRAAAENAMNQWNAGALNNTSATNAGFKQQANATNAGNAQNVSNQNTGLANYRTGYNANVPQQVFEDEMNKAAGLSGAAKNYGSTISQQGNQNAALNLGLINAGIQGVGAMAGVPSAGAGKSPSGYNPNMTENMLPGAAHGALVMDLGGSVPGQAKVPGDSLKNDRVHAMLSPGEVVVPRSIAPHPEAVKQFVTHLLKNKPVQPAHPDDVHAVLAALGKRREPNSIGSPRG